jgi:cell division septation protein DedD
MTTSDEGFREIHLNGKQLVFLFMAVTVVSVVIFLLGVLVGRGVQTRPTVAAEAATAPQDDATVDAATPPATEPLEPTKADGLGYPERLEATGPVAENLVTRPEATRPQGPTTAAPATTAPPSVAAPASAPAPPRQAPAEHSKPAQGVAAGAAPADKVAPLPPEPKGDGMAIQVAALRGRSEADAVVARLKGKGYSAYIVPALPGQPAGFRVRVGKFKTRAEAEKVAAKLEQEEQFKPWITR